MPSSYKGDPYWTIARFASACCKCGRSIRKGESIYYYPKGKKVFCDSASCDKAANADFRSMVEDEDFYNRRSNPASKWGRVETVRLANGSFAQKGPMGVVGWKYLNTGEDGWMWRGRFLPSRSFGGGKAIHLGEFSSKKEAIAVGARTAMYGESAHRQGDHKHRRATRAAWKPNRRFGPDLGMPRVNPSDPVATFRRKWNKGRGGIYVFSHGTPGVPTLTDAQVLAQVLGATVHHVGMGVFIAKKGGQEVFSFLAGGAMDRDEGDDFSYSHLSVEPGYRNQVLSWFRRRYPGLFTSLDKSMTTHWRKNPGGALSWSEWMRKYQPETRTYEHRDVAKKNPRYVWTLVKGDDGGRDVYVVPGFAVVNSIRKYMVSRKPWSKSALYQEAPMLPRRGMGPRFTRNPSSTGVSIRYVGGMGDDEYWVKFGGRVIAKAFISLYGEGKWNWAIEGGASGIADSIGGAERKAMAEAMRMLRRSGGRRRLNPGLGMPGMPHTWVTKSGVRVSGGDLIEFWVWGPKEFNKHSGHYGPGRRTARRATVNRMLVFDDHVMANSGTSGTYVDDRNFIRVVRHAAR